MDEKSLMEINKARNHMLNHINNHDLKLKVDSVLEDIWQDFTISRPSKTGKYHHVCENYLPGGMINHVLRGLWFLEHLIREEGIKDVNEQDELYAAMILHDIGKIKGSEYKHGLIGSKMLAAEHGFPEVICKMVSHHMHHWHQTEAQNVKERLICYADYLASRPELDIEGCKVLEIQQDGSVIYE